MSSNHTLRPPPRPRSPGSQSASVVSPTLAHRSTSSLSNASTDSHVGELAMHKRHPYVSSGRPSTAGGPSASSSSLQNFSRPTPRASMDNGMRIHSPPLTGAPMGHRSRQHSQGFFEPSLPHTSSNNVPTLGTLSASQIAAQAAMHHVQAAQQERKRSTGSLAPVNTATGQARRVPSPIYVPPAPSTTSGNLAYSNGTLGGRHLAATTAANAAFPRSPLPSPNPQSAEYHVPPTNLSESRTQSSMAPPTQEVKTKERSKMNMKLFSKPKNIGISKDKDYDKKNPALPSPVKGVLRSGFANMSTTSLADPIASSSASSLYSSVNASTSTLVPTTTTTSGLNPDKDKHRHHHFLSRQKQKLKESAEHRNLPLSSASSNSQAVDPSAPSSLYSFAPASPGFSKSVSGFDLRHGGRALREKKKEEKAAAAVSASALTPIMSNSSANLSRYDDTRSEFIGPSSLETGSVISPPTNMPSSVFSFPSLEQTPTLSAMAFSNLGNTMGLTGITPDDAWPLLKARLLNIFEGEDLRTPIEDFNLLVSVHVRRCIQKRAPILIIEDLRELLYTGFTSLGQTLRSVPDGRLVPKIVEMWITVFGTILPFIQAVFLPLDLEFKGQGSIMSQREASEFWGAFMPEESAKADERPSSSGGTVKLPSLGEQLDVRRITLIVFRDVVVLPKHESLMAIFSRLSLDSIKTEPSPSLVSSPPDFGSRSRGLSNPATTGGGTTRHRRQPLSPPQQLQLADLDPPRRGLDFIRRQSQPNSHALARHIQHLSRFVWHFAPPHAVTALAAPNAHPRRLRPAHICASAALAAGTHSGSCKGHRDGGAYAAVCQCAGGRADCRRRTRDHRTADAGAKVQLAWARQDRKAEKRLGGNESWGEKR